MKKDWMIRESELDDDQLIVLQATLDKSCVVTGCAGSGKSVLALIKAQRIQREKDGSSYKIIVFTKALCKYMNEGKRALGLLGDMLYLWDWKRQFTENQQQADYIIVDEIQDFSEEEIRTFMANARKEFFFYGDAAQSVYNGMRLPNGDVKVTVNPEDIISSIAPKDRKTKNFELYRNYRLPLPVARVVQYIGRELPTLNEFTYKSREVQPPFFLKYEDQDAQVTAIAEIIKRRDLSDIAVLVGTNKEVEKVGSIFRNLKVDFECKYKRDDESWDNLNFQTLLPKIMTYHSAKGLQFEAVFMPFIEAYEDRFESSRSALYVAMTRAYRYLYIMYSGQLPELLTQIPKELYREQEVEKIEEI